MKPVLSYYREAWGVITRMPALIGVVTLYFVVSAFLSYVAEIPDQVFLRLALMGLSYLIQFALALGLLRSVLKAVDGGSPRLADLLEGYPYLPSALGAYVLAVLSVVLGFLALILPGIYVSIRLQFVLFATVEDRKALDALKISWEITRGVFWKLVAFGLVGLLVNLVGLMAFLVGIVITGPLTFTAQALLYRDLLSRGDGDHGQS